MATIQRKEEVVCRIRRSFHKPISKTFIKTRRNERGLRETERLIEIGQYQDTSEANKTTLKAIA
jgi:hypothetical protein